MDAGTVTSKTRMKHDSLTSLVSESETSGGSRGGARGPPPPLFWVKKEEMTEGKMADRARQTDRQTDMFVYLESYTININRL